VAWPTALATLVAVAAALVVALAVVRDRRRSERRDWAVAEAARNFEVLVERSSDPVILLDATGVITYLNPSAMEVFGYGPERIGTSALSILHPDDALDAAQMLLAAEAANEPGAVGEPTALPPRTTLLRRVRAGDGRWIHCETVNTNLLAEPGVRGIVVVLRDVTERIAAEEAAAAEHRFTQTILDTTTALVVTASLDGRLISMNRAAEELTGYRTAEVAGQRWERFVPADERRAVEVTLAGLAADLPPTSTENHWVSRSGRRHLIAWTNAFLTDPDGEPSTIVATGIDITEARRAERAVRQAEQREHDRLAWDATHDALTGLLNRAGLLDRLDHLLAAPEAQPVGLLFLDLDGFKAVNDHRGHAVGDRVLQEVGRRLADAVRADDVVGRLGGDEFVVLCPGLDVVPAIAAAERVEGAVSEPLVVDGEAVAIGVSTGAVSAIGATATELLEQADAAMYSVKRDRQRHRHLAPRLGGPPPHPEEERRLRSVAASGLLESAADPFVDTIVRMASEVCGTPMAAVSVVGQDHQHLVSTVGLDVDETPRADAFCAYTVLDDAHPFVVEDAGSDPRFRANPLVVGDPGIRFYAGSPIAVADEPPLGSLCVIDDRPRQLSRAQLSTLDRLRDSLVTYLEHRDRVGVDASSRPGAWRVRAERR
jgi:diguanylate cyclase (GGDEF)-like protein/PAS domain S-box-containing protein